MTSLAGTYEIEAKGTTTEGCHFSSLLSYRVLNPVSAQTSQPIKVFPNPTSDHITILGRVSHLDILSLNGQKIRTMQTPNQVDLSSLKTGVYLLRLYTREGITLRKLIIR